MADTWKDQTDPELVRAAGSGDMDALGALYARHHRTVYELCCRLLGSPDAAEDLTHEAFLRVRRYGESFDGRSSVDGWLYRLVRNRCLDFLADRRREEDHKKTWKAELRIRRMEHDDVDDERAALVRQALDTLKPEWREVLVLSRFGGMKYREIAEACDLSLSNVKVRAHRAMKALHTALKELEACP